MFKVTYKVRVNSESSNKPVLYPFTYTREEFSDALKILINAQASDAIEMKLVQLDDATEWRKAS